MAACNTQISEQIDKDFLQCKICFEVYRTPRTLSCLHSFCEPCLEKLLDKKNGTVTCPECRTVSDLQGCVQNAKASFFINSLLDLFRSKTTKESFCSLCPALGKSAVPASSRCLDCADFLCASCAQGHCLSKLTLMHKVVSLQDFVSGHYDNEARSKEERHCQSHRVETSTQTAADTCPQEAIAPQHEPSELKTEPKPEPKAQSQLKPQVKAQPRSQQKAPSQLQPQSQPKARPQAQSQPKAQPQPQSKQKTQPKLQPLHMAQSQCWAQLQLMVPQPSFGAPNVYIPAPALIQSFDIDLIRSDKNITGLSVFPSGDIIFADNRYSVIYRLLRKENTTTILCTWNDPFCLAVCNNKVFFISGYQLFKVQDGGAIEHTINLDLKGSRMQYAITAYKNKYVAVTEVASCRLTLYNPQGRKIGHVNPKYSGGRLAYLTVNSREEFIASDTVKKCIVVFRRSGEVISICVCADSFSFNPGCVCVDMWDNIYAIEGRRIILLTAWGQFVRVLLNFTDGYSPKLITADCYGHLIMVDKAGMVRIYKV